jgi:hypothetical protein
MKTLIAAIALTIAVPAFAQTADPHAAHKAAGHERHEGHKMDCCKDADGNGKMDCCESTDGKDNPCCDEAAEAAAGHDQHSGHSMSH